VPPRHAYWTILIDDTPTAFRAREREELQPTFVQLQRKNANVTMQWFARGKLWASREAERDDFQTQKHAESAPREPRGDRPPAAERRGGDWRPGGAHKDPRDRFKKKNRPERAWSEKDPATQRDRDKPGYAAKPWGDKPVGPARGDRPWSKKPDGPPAHRSSSDRGSGGGGWQPKPRGDRPPASGGWRDKQAGEKRPWSGKPSDRPGPPRERKPWDNKPAPPNDRPWQTKPTGPRAQRKPWVGKPGPPGEGAGFKPRGDRPPARNSSDRPRSEGGWTPKPPSGEKRPWSSKPPDRSGPPRGDRPPAHRSSFDSRKSEGGWRGKPAGEGKRPWSGKPPDRSGPPRGDRPPGQRSSSDRPGPKAGWSGKPRDSNRKPFTPRGPRPGGAPSDGVPRKRRDDDE
jgi:23S rRNA pseudouridine2605 synthase